jgi:hypothetical protein
MALQLVYFHFPGRAEVARLILAIGKKEFEVIWLISGPAAGGRHGTEVIGGATMLELGKLQCMQSRCSLALAHADL